MKKIYSILLALFCTLSLHAQTVTEPQETKPNLIKAALKGWHVYIGGGLNLGGTSPLPIPAEIRKIDSYNPTLNIAIQGGVQKKFGKHWGILTGVRFENKAMKTDATVKNYHMEAKEDDGSDIVGAFTGHVKTKVSNNYITIPLLATYTINPRWQLQAGPYVSWLLNGEFSGEAYGNPQYDENGELTGYDAYIRDQDPTGERTEVSHATYDFSNDLRRFQWGIQVGGTFMAYKHLAVSANLNWGLNGIFPSDFSSVTFSLYPIYGSLAFAYIF